MTQVQHHDRTAKIQMNHVQKGTMDSNCDAVHAVMFHLRCFWNEDHFHCFGKPLQGFIHILLCHCQGRSDTQDVASTSGQDQQLLLSGCFLNCSALLCSGKHNTQEQTSAADLQTSRFTDLLKACFQMSARGSHALQKSGGAHTLEHIAGSSAHQWSACEGAAMVSRRDAGSHSLCEEHCANRQSTRKWLSQSHQIRCHARYFVSKELTTSPQATLHLVENQQCAGLVATLPQC
mmetsp:Transcript_1746/g.3059  ORF Transcript_1746/g.3059 Transcript_1746/m.3059 type:complete len:234 (-) Transcript_1746:899-1600(-)